VSAALFSTIRGERPVIILDDVLSELDENHQRALLLRLKSHQVFVTTTHPLEHPDIQLWSVNKGVVVPQRDMASVRSEYAP
jgi:DNA replication and repair protein RecF